MKYRSCLTLLIGLHSFVLLPFAYAEPSPREWKCRYYANDAVKQNQQNVTAGCGFTGLRWSDHRDGHHSWCLSVAETQTDKENTARNKALEECFKEKSSLQNKENHPEIPASCKDSTGEYTPVRSLYSWYRYSREIRTPVKDGLIKFDFNRDSQPDYVFVEQNAKQKVQLVSCISTGEKETVSYQRKPSEVVFSAEGDSLMSYGHHVSMQNDQLHLLLTYFGHNEGSSSTDAYYSYDISNQSFQIVDTKSSKSPVMTSNGGIAQEPYPIYVPFAPLLGGKPLSTDTVNADAELVAKDKAALIDDRYIDKDETIVDIEMGLEWKKCSEGQTGQQCAGLGSAYMWTDAMQLASESNFAGYDDWRLPTSTELRSLRYCDYDSEKHLSNTNSPGCDWLKGGERTKNYKKPTIRQKLFPNTQYGKKDSWYWSSSDGETTGESAIVVNFNDGYYPFESKHEYGFIRLVRKADLPIGQ